MNVDQFTAADWFRFAQLILRLRSLTDPKHIRRELRIDLRHLGRNDFAHQAQRLGAGSGGDGHTVRPFEIKPGVLDHLLETVPRMYARQPEAAPSAVESEQATVGDQADRPAASIDIIWT